VKKQFSVFAAQVAEGRGGSAFGESCNACEAAQQGMCVMKNGSSHNMVQAVET
jgi:hypothetical protein